MARSELVHDELWELVKSLSQDRTPQRRWRWVLERTFAWLSQNRRMSNPYERLRVTGEMFVYIAMTRLMVRRLARAR
jgi:hypothetical protein